MDSTLAHCLIFRVHYTLVFLSTQTFRHIHVKYFAPKTSVLDVFDESTEKEIKESNNLNELVAIYTETQTKVKEYEETKSNKEIEVHERQAVEPYKSDYKARQAIANWEEYNYQILKLRFYWCCGLVSIIIGCLLYVKIDMWIGMVGLITGFSEMIFWTCPTFIGVFGSRVEFERLLKNKLIFSLLAWLILISIWFFLYKIKGKDRKIV